MGPLVSIAILKKAKKSEGENWSSARGDVSQQLCGAAGVATPFTALNRDPQSSSACTSSCPSLRLLHECLYFLLPRLKLLGERLYT